MRLLIRDDLQQKEEVPRKVGLGLLQTESQLKEKRKQFFSNVNRVSKE